MKTFQFTFIISILWSNLWIAQFAYPTTITVDDKETLWGVTIEDPYRWLEDIEDEFKALLELDAY